MLATFRAPVLALWPTQAATHGQPARACQRLVLRHGNMRQRLILWPPAVFLHATQYRWEFGWHWFPSHSGHLVWSAVCWTYLWTTEEWRTNILLCSFLFFGSYPFFQSLTFNLLLEGVLDIFFFRVHVLGEEGDMRHILLVCLNVTSDIWY